MKRWRILSLAAVLVLTCAACGGRRESPQPSGSLLPPEYTGTPEVSPSPPPPVPPAQASSSPVDLDLAALSSTMVYAEVSNIMSAPNDYIGKTIRIKGIFSSYQEPETQKVYCSVVVPDATACCARGFDVVMPSQARYPDDYPAAQSEVVVVGTMQADRTLESYGLLVLRLEAVRFE